MIPNFLWLIIAVKLRDLLARILYIKLEGKSIAILGMPESGKTQLYKTLQNDPSPCNATPVEDYEDFTFSIGDKKYKVNAGRDIGGGVNYIKIYYDKFIKEKDIIFFVFDVKRYIENEEYAKSVGVRLDFVKSRLDEKYGSNIFKGFVLIASHADQLSISQAKNCVKVLHETVKQKSYESLFHNNLFIANLKDNKQILEFFEKKGIFE